MKMNEWEALSDCEKQKRIRAVIRTGLRDFYKDFGGYTESGEFLPMFSKFLEITKQYYEARAHFGAKAVWEVLRWHSLTSDRGAEFKLNNNYTSSTALLAKRLFPEELDHFFKTRKRIAA